MKSKLLAVIAMIAIAITSCDDTTDTIGGSISGNMDNVDIQTAVYNITSRSIISDSVLSRNTTGYLGKVKDPETGRDRKSVV